MFTNFNLIKNLLEKNTLKMSIKEYIHEIFIEKDRHQYLIDALNVLNNIETISLKKAEYLFVNRKKELRKLAKIIANLKYYNYPENYHIIIGEKGIGKKTTLNVMLKIIKESFPNFQYLFHRNFKFRSDFETNLYCEKFFRSNGQKLHIRVIDLTNLKNYNNLSRKINMLIDPYTYTFLILHDYQDVLNLNQTCENLTYFNRYSNFDLKKILYRRIEFAEYLESINNKLINFEFYTQIKSKYIPQIISMAKGNVGVAFMMAKKIAQNID